MPVPAQESPAERRQRLMDRLTEARRQGVSWEAINQSLSNRVEAARKAGVSDLAIQQSLGFSSPEELIAATRSEAQQHLTVTKPTGWVDAFWSGLTHSSGAALMGVTPDETPVEGRIGRIASVIGETVGDIPATIAGGVAGGAAGGAAGGVAGIETGPGALLTSATGAYVGAGAGSMALPQLIKSERDRFIRALNRGEVRGPEDFLNIQALVMKDTAEAAAVGVATAGVGRIVGKGLNKIGAGKGTRIAGTVAAEGATMVSAQAALAGQMPRTEDFVDAAIVIGAFHTAVHLTPAGYRSVRERLQQNYVETGELPRTAAERATNDPVFRAQMLGRPEPNVPPGSSRTRLMSSTSMRPLGEPPPAPPGFTPVNEYIVPRTTGDFDRFLPFVMSDESSMTAGAGGQVKYGLSAREHPGVDIANLSREDAAEIYHREYWRAIDADALPPELRLPAFDSAVSEGIHQTRAWLKEANGDFDKFMQLRTQKYARLARDPKHADAAAGWADHIETMRASARAQLPAGIYQGLKARGIPDHLARGIAAGAHAESRGDPNAINPTSGAMGIGQWLGSRRKELVKRYGPNPTLDQQLDFLVYELRGGDVGGKSVMSGRNEVDTLRRYIVDFMRPAKGRETSGDIERGMAALGRKGEVTQQLANIVRNGPENIGKEFTPEQVALLGLDEGGGGRKPPGGPSEEPPSFEPGDGGSLARIKSRVASDEGRDWLGGTVDTFKSIYGELFDPTHPIRRLVDGVTKGEPLDDYSNPELLWHAANGSNTVARWAIKEEMVDFDGNVTGPGLESIITGKSSGQKFSRSEIDDFLNGYALAKWTLMMEEQGKKTGIDPADARKVVAEGEAKFEKPFQELVGWRNSTLKWLGDAGVVDKSKVDKWIAENGSTIPGYRRMQDGSWRPVNTGKPGIWNPIKSAKGSERQIEPILKSLMQDAFLRHQLASNNRVIAAIADLGLLGNEATQKRAVDINIVTAIEALKEEGISEDMLSSLAKSAGQMVPKDEIPVFRDGKLYSVKFEDRDLTRLLRGYDQKARSVVVKIAAAITSVPRNMQTRYNPLFPIRNAFYDMVQQSVTNPDAIRPLSGFYDGLGHMIGDAEGYKAWGRSGAAEYIFTQISNDAFIKSVMKGHEELSLMANAWNVVNKSTFGALNAWARVVSVPPRLSRYARGVEKGETPLRAAIASSETATPPAHYGGRVGRAWNSIAPYTTAYLNGLEKTVRAVLGLGHTVTGVKYDWRKTLIKGAAIITAPMIAQWFAYKDEDWYKAMPDWQKNNSWFIIPPLGDLPAIPIAAPPLLSTIFITTPRMLLERFASDNPHAFDNFWESMGASLMPPNWVTSASILTPIVEHITNWSFFRDRPMVDQNMVRGVQPAEQFTPYTSPAAKELAQFVSDLPLVHSNFGWSPAVIDNYISNWGGPMGRLAAQKAAILLDKPSNPPIGQKVSDWPGISSWTVRYPSANAAPIQQFYDRATQLDQMYGSLRKQIREGDFEGFKRIVDRGGPSAAAWQHLSLGEKVPPGVDTGPYRDYLMQVSAGADRENIRLARQAARGLQRAREYSWRVYANRNIESDEKRQLLDMANAQMQVMAERGNEALDRALIGVRRRGSSAQAPIPDAIVFEPPPAVMAQ